jgi:hypothetical protein
MRKANSLLIAALVATGMLASAVSSRAVTVSPSSQINILTFNQPVKLPGVVLPAGTYRFELAPAGTHQDIVKVSSRSGMPYYLGFTRVVERPTTLPKNMMIQFGETTGGVPPPIAVWYPTHTPSGHAFVYR